MSERKAINKYYPPDFDPSQIKRVRKKKQTGPSSWPTVRLMIPFSMKCLKCNEFISKSKKFNAKKEITKEDYLGIKIIHFHFRCPRCFNDLIFGTDPKNGDFECVSGCKRNYERSSGSKSGEKKKEEETMEDILARLEEEDRLEVINKERERRGKRGIDDANAETETGLEQLERRMRQQQKEQEMVDEIDDLQQRNQRLEVAKRRMVGGDGEDEMDRRDEEEARRAFERRGKVGTRRVAVRTPSKVDEGVETRVRLTRVEVGSGEVETGTKTGVSPPSKMEPEVSPPSLVVAQVVGKSVQPSSLNLLNGYTSDSSSE